MRYRLQLPDDKEITLRYDKTVYNPRFSAVDTIVVAHRLMRPGIRVHDVATGCGVVGLSLKLLNPDIEVSLSDIDKNAVQCAKKNAKLLGLDVSVRVRELPPAEQYDMITANLPTYDLEQMKTATLSGPEGAYYGGKDGLDLYRKLFSEAKAKVIVAECQYDLQERFLEMVTNLGWRLILRTDFGFAFLNGATEEAVRGEEHPLIRQVPTQPLH